MQYYHRNLARQSKRHLTTFSVVDIAMTDDFIMTIDSGDEEVSVLRQSKNKRTAPEVGDETVALDPSFSFDLTGDTYTDILYKETAFQDVVKAGSKPVRRRIRCS